MALSVLPDAESLVIRYLQSKPEVTSLLAGGAAGIVSAGARDTFPFLRVTQPGGTIIQEKYMGAPRIRFACFANKKSQASNVARTVLAAMWEIAPQVGFAAITAPQWLPDPDTGIKQYVFEGIVTVTRTAS